ncbi:MAG: hypothetical protein Q8P67_03115 [archaeon]|nr:hypothetical protein [archaeon]
MINPQWLIPGNPVWFRLEEGGGWMPGRILKLKTDHRQRAVIHYYDGMGFLKQCSVSLKDILPFDDEQLFETDQEYDGTRLRNLYLLKYFHIPELAKRLTLVAIRQHGFKEPPCLHFGPYNYLSLAPLPKVPMPPSSVFTAGTKPELPPLPWKSRFVSTVRTLHPNATVVLITAQQGLIWHCAKMCEELLEQVSASCHQADDRHALMPRLGQALEVLDMFTGCMMRLPGDPGLCVEWWSDGEAIAQIAIAVPFFEGSAVIGNPASRLFSIFYGLVDRANAQCPSSEMKANYAVLDEYSDYQLLRHRPDRMDMDVSDVFHRVERSMLTVFGVSASEWDCVLRLLSALLLLGNLQFEQGIRPEFFQVTKDPHNQRLLEMVQTLVADSPREHHHLDPALQRLVEQLTDDTTAELALHRITVLVASVYDRIVEWVLQKLNVRLCGPEALPKDAGCLFRVLRMPAISATVGHHNARQLLKVHCTHEMLAKLAIQQEMRYFVQQSNCEPPSKPAELEAIEINLSRFVSILDTDNRPAPSTASSSSSSPTSSVQDSSSVVMDHYFGRREYLSGEWYLRRVLSESFASYLDGPCRAIIGGGVGDLFKRFDRRLQSQEGKTVFVRVIAPISPSAPAALICSQLKEHGLSLFQAMLGRFSQSSLNAVSAEDPLHLFPLIGGARCNTVDKAAILVDEGNGCELKLLEEPPGVEEGIQSGRLHSGPLHLYFLKRELATVTADPPACDFVLPFKSYRPRAPPDQEEYALLASQGLLTQEFLRPIMELLTDVCSAEELPLQTIYQWSVGAARVWQAEYRGLLARSEASRGQVVLRQLKLWRVAETFGCLIGRRESDSVHFLNRGYITQLSVVIKLFSYHIADALRYPARFPDPTFALELFKRLIAVVYDFASHSRDHCHWMGLENLYWPLFQALVLLLRIDWSDAPQILAAELSETCRYQTANRLATVLIHMLQTAKSRKLIDAQFSNSVKKMDLSYQQLAEYIPGAVQRLCALSRKTDRPPPSLQGSEAASEAWQRAVDHLTLKGAVLFQFWAPMVSPQRWRETLTTALGSLPRANASFVRCMGLSLLNSKHPTLLADAIAEGLVQVVLWTMLSNPSPRQSAQAAQDSIDRSCCIVLCSLANESLYKPAVRPLVRQVHAICRSIMQILSPHLWALFERAFTNLSESNVRFIASQMAACGDVTREIARNTCLNQLATRNFDVLQSIVEAPQQSIEEGTPVAISRMSTEDHRGFQGFQGDDARWIGWDFEAHQPAELSVRKGERVAIVETANSLGTEWTFVVGRHGSGFVPSSYLLREAPPIERESSGAGGMLQREAFDQIELSLDDGEDVDWDEESESK